MGMGRRSICSDDASGQAFTIVVVKTLIVNCCLVVFLYNLFIKNLLLPCLCLCLLDSNYSTHPGTLRLASRSQAIPAIFLNSNQSVVASLRRQSKVPQHRQREHKHKQNGGTLLVQSSGEYSQPGAADAATTAAFYLRVNICISA